MFNIIWLTHDLRLYDNYSLIKGSKLPIIMIYIIRQDYQYNTYSFWWLLQELIDLQIRLQSLGGNLLIFNYEDKLMENIIIKLNPKGIYWSQSYEPLYREWSNNIESFCTNNNIFYEISPNNHYYPPEKIFNKMGHNYKVFTPFWNELQTKTIEDPHDMPLLNFYKTNLISINIQEEYQTFLMDHDFLKEYWQPGEINGHNKIKKFLENNVLNYKSNRDYPAKKNTSEISPYLRWGSISDRQIVAMINYMYGNKDKIFLPININKINNIDGAMVEPFIRQLGWRNFSYHLLWHYPTMINENLKEEFNNFPWVYDENLFNKWKDGKTGYPIIDAGMMQLKKTGQIHNRIRMVVASFLTKDLKIHWTWGAQHFWNYLMDADEANNSASWQWVAGCGMDAAPYFRIFNPILQSLKFDPEGDYIRQWIPILKNVSNKCIHDPWNHDNLPIILGLDYPHPIIDHNIEKKLALDGYKIITNK